MVNASDLKSDAFGRVGSNPAVGDALCYIFFSLFPEKNEDLVFEIENDKRTFCSLN